MFKLIALSLATFAMATSTANASTLRLPHKPFAQMTRVEKVHYLRRQIRHDKSIIRYYHNHRTLESEELVHAWKWAKTSLRIASRNLKRYTYHPAYASATGGFPPHHTLWVCIHNNEGPWDDADGGYDGGLQMSQGWFKMFSGSAGRFSQVQQEWFAEKAYAANHYSWSFLNQQWFEWDNADYCAKYG